MVIFIILFGIVLGIVRSILLALIISTTAVYSILALMIFAFLMLTFIHSTRRIAWIGFVAVILCYVAMDIITSSPNEVMIFMSLAVSIPITLLIKRRMWHWIRMDEHIPVELGGPRFSPTTRLILRFI